MLVLKVFMYTEPPADLSKSPADFPTNEYDEKHSRTKRQHWSNDEYLLQALEPITLCTARNDYGCVIELGE